MEAYFLIVGVVGLVLSIWGMALAISLVRRGSRIRNPWDLTRFVVAIVAALVMAGITGVRPPGWLALAAIGVGVALGTAQGLAQDVRLSEAGPRARHSWVATAVFAAGLILTEVSSLADRRETIEVGLAIIWLSAGLTVGLVMGRSRGVSDARRLAGAAAAATLVLAGLALLVAPRPAAARSTAGATTDAEDVTDEQAMAVALVGAAFAAAAVAGAVTESGVSIRHGFDTWQRRGLRGLDDLVAHDGGAVATLDTDLDDWAGPPLLEEAPEPPAPLVEPVAPEPPAPLVEPAAPEPDDDAAVDAGPRTRFDDELDGRNLERIGKLARLTGLTEQYQQQGLSFEEAATRAAIETWGTDVVGDVISAQDRVTAPGIGMVGGAFLPPRMRALIPDEFSGELLRHGMRLGDAVASEDPAAFDDVFDQVRNDPNGSVMRGIAEARAVESAKAAGSYSLCPGGIAALARMTGWQPFPWSPLVEYLGTAVVSPDDIEQLVAAGLLVDKREERRVRRSVERAMMALSEPEVLVEVSRPDKAPFTVCRFGETAVEWHADDRRVAMSFPLTAAGRLQRLRELLGADEDSVACFAMAASLGGFELDLLMALGAAAGTEPVAVDHLMAAVNQGGWNADLAITNGWVEHLARRGFLIRYDGHVALARGAAVFGSRLTYAFAVTRVSFYDPTAPPVIDVLHVYRGGERLLTTRRVGGTDAMPTIEVRDVDRRQLADMIYAFTLDRAELGG